MINNHYYYDRIAQSTMRYAVKDENFLKKKLEGCGFGIIKYNNDFSDFSLDEDLVSKAVESTIAKFKKIEDDIIRDRVLAYNAQQENNLKLYQMEQEDSLAKKQVLKNKNPGKNSSSLSDLLDDQKIKNLENLRNNLSR